MIGRPSKRQMGGLLALPSLALLVPILVVPVAAILLVSLQGGDAEGWSLAAYTSIARTPYYAVAFLRTVSLGAGVAALSLVLGLPVAWWMVCQPRWRGPLMAALAGPLLVNVVARLYGWQLLLAERGPVNRLLALLLPGMQPLQFFGTAAGVVIVSCHVMLPYAVIGLFTAMRAIDPAVLDAARSLSSPWRAFWRVVVPLCVPAALAAFTLVLTLAASSFVVPAVVGGGRFNTFPTLIYQQMMAFNLPRAAALAGCLLVALAPVAWFARRRQGSAA